MLSKKGLGDGIVWSQQNKRQILITLLMSAGLAMGLLANELGRIPVLNPIIAGDSALFFSLSLSGVFALLAAAWFRHHSHVSPAFQAASIIASAALTSLAVVFRFISPEGIPLALNVMFYRITCTALFIVWGRILFSYGLRQVILATSVALGLLGVLEVILCFPPAPVAIITISTAPLFSGGIALLLTKRADDTDLDHSDAAYKIGQSPALYAVSMIGYTFVFGSIQNVWWSSDQSGITTVLIQASYGIGCLLCGLVLFLFARLIMPDERAPLHLLLPIPALVIALYFSAVLEAEPSPIFLIPLSTAQKMSILFLFVAFIPKGKWGALPSFCIVLAAYRFGQAINFIPFPISDDLFIKVIVGIVVAILMTQAFLSVALASNSLRTRAVAEDEFIFAGEASISRDELNDLIAQLEADKETYALLAKQYHLTQRESEVLPFVANERPASYIAEKLFISIGTAKTHIRNIYSKMGIHSRQELLNIVNSARHNQI